MDKRYSVTIVTREQSIMRLTRKVPERIKNWPQFYPISAEEMEEEFLVFIRLDLPEAHWV